MSTIERTAYDPVSYYSTQSPISDPGPWGKLYDPLPCDAKELFDVVQGLFLHVFWAERYGITLKPDQQQHVQSRKVHHMLDVIQGIDPAPLSRVRPPEKRFFGNCRDHSVLLCSLLRAKGIPARARCGFGRYFRPDWFEDHWVCEYWNPARRRWVMVDAQLDQLQREVLGIPFDPLDMPPGQFVSGAEAWRMCRSGQADPNQFGIFDMHGLWCVRGNFIRDVAALNKVELLPWDGWGLADKRDGDLTADDLSLMDRLADCVMEDSSEVLSLYRKHSGLKVPRVIRSYVNGRPLDVDLGF